MISSINGLMQNCSNSIANALVLLQICTKPSIYYLWNDITINPPNSTYVYCVLHGFLLFHCVDIISSYWFHVIDLPNPHSSGLFQCFPQNMSALQGLTLWGWDKMATSFQTTFSNAFSWMKIYELWLKLNWSLFLMVQLSIFQQWFR